MEADLQQLFITLVSQLENLVRPSPKPQVYTIEEVAGILKCKESTIKNLIHRSRELRTCQIGRELRIRDEDLREFLLNKVTSCVFDEGVLR